MDEALKTFVDLIAKAEHIPDEHQYILKPVSGTGKIKLNKRYGGDAHLSQIAGRPKPASIWSRNTRTLGDRIFFGG